MIVFLLLRPRLLPLLESIHHTVLRNAHLREDGTEKPIERFGEILHEAVRYKLHGRNWYLHGSPAGKAAQEPRSLTWNNLSYHERLAIIEELHNTYSWCLVPWGGYGTAQMLAFISSDAAGF